MSQDPETPALPSAEDAAAALRRRESELRALVDTIPDIVFQIDRDYRLVAANEHFMQAAAASQGKPIALGETVLTAQYPEELTRRWREYYERAFAGESFAAETSAPRADGTHHVENYLGPVRGADGEVAGVVVTSRDITEHRRLQNELDDERQRYKLLVEHSSEAILQFELDGELLTANPAACLLFGCSQDRLREIGRDGLLDPSECRFQEALAVRDLTGHHSGVFSFVRADGTMFPGEASTTVYTDHHGVQLTSVAIRDLTEQKAAEETLRDMKTMRDASEHIARVASYRWDFTAPRPSWSREIYTLLDVTPGEFDGDVMRALDARVHPDDRALLQRDIDAVAERGELAPIDFRVVHRDGSTRIMHGEGTAERGADGRVSTLVGYLQDITGRKAAEAALRESETMRDVAEKVAKAGFWRWERGTHDLSVSPGLFSLFDVDPAEYRGDVLALIDARVHPDDKAQLLQAMTAFDEEGRQSSAGCRIVHRDGSEHYLHMEMATESDASGAVVAATGYYQDVTEQRQIEAELSEREERYRTLVETMAQGVVYHDAHGAIMDANPAAERILGLSLSQMQGRASMDPGWRAVHEDGSDFPGEGHPAMVSLRTAQPVSDIVMGVFNPAADSYRWIMVNAVPQFLPGESAPYRVFAAFVDITELKRNEEALRESKRMRDITENVARVGSVRWDFSTGRAEWSPETYRLFALTPEQFDGDSSVVFKTRVHPDDRARLEEALARAVSTGKISGTDVRVVWPDGSEHILHGEGSTQYAPDGTVEAITGYFQEVTERRHAEAEVLRLNDILEESLVTRTAQLDGANRELESYAIAHDVRAPLRAIDGFSAAVLEDEGDRLSEAAVTDLRRVRAAAQEMARLLDDLMGFTRVTRRDLLRRAVDVSAMAADVAAELEADNSARHVAVVIQPGLVAEADVTLLRVILRELLGNAWKFTSHHESARVEVGALDLEGERVFFVRDDGAGFDPRYAGHLFGFFQRMHTRGEFPGDGVGLATVQRLVRRHGGRVWAEAEVEKGATFSFTLPAAADPAD